MADNSQNTPNANGDIFNWNDIELLQKYDDQIHQKYLNLLDQIELDKKKLLEIGKQIEETWKYAEPTYLDLSYIHIPADSGAYQRVWHKKKQELVFETPEQETKYREGVARIVSRYPWLKKVKTC